jgi:signal transduction histidine kinase
MRRRFARRAGMALAAFITIGVLLTLVIGTIASWLTASNSFVGALVTWAVLLLLAVVFVRRLRRAAAPVGDLVEAAARVESGDYAVRVPERGPREVRGLARAFNAMSAQLEETDASRRRLLADVSHELRTPLTVMQGTLEGILDGVYPADAAHLTPVLEETRVLARLIDDLRTLSLSEAGMLKLHREPTDLARLLNEVAAGHRAAADEAGVSLTVEAASDLPTLELDPARVRQVVSNLIANALRFTPRGGRVILGAVPTEDGGASVLVRDSGTGIPPEALEHVFDRFYRSPGSSGSGLGLPIARNLVEAHGGRIELDSPPDGGTEVRFTLPPT